jgi:outer membrane protein assembly factor BamB
VLRTRVGAGVVATAMALVIAGSAAAAVPPGSIPVGQSWQTNGRVETVVISGSTAYLGGEFTSVRPSGDPVGTGEVARNHAAAIDLSTGALLPWDPNANSTVQTIAVSGSTVYLGGTFGTVGGKTHARVAAVDATTGVPDQVFKAKTNGEVMSLAVGPSGLYMGGAFTQADKIARNYLAEVDLSTGALVTSFTATASARVNAVALTTDGTRLVVAGTFTSLDGSILQRFIGAVSPSTGALLAWANHPGYQITTLAVDANGVYGAGTGNGGNFVAYNPTTGVQLWIGGADGNTQAIAVVDGTVYVGGHFNNYCGHVLGTNACATPTARDHLLAVDEMTGNILPWHPSANGVLGVFALAGGAGTIEAGGDFTKLGGVSQQGFGEFPEISLPTLTDSAGGQPTSVSPVTVTASGSTDSAPGFAGYKYETSTDGGVTWSALRSGPTATVKTVGTTLVRFEAVDAYGNTSGWITDSVTIT